MRPLPLGSPPWDPCYWNSLNATKQVIEINLVSRAAVLLGCVLGRNVPIRGHTKRRRKLWGLLTDQKKMAINKSTNTS